MKANLLRPTPVITNQSPRLTALCLIAGLLFYLFARSQPTNPLVMEPSGVYTLVGIDGQPVPAMISHGSQIMRIESGVFTIQTNGQCFSRMVFSVGIRTNLVRDTQATYTLRGPELEMRWRGAGRTKGVVDGQTFTMKNEDMVFVYRRQSPKF